MKEFEEWFNKKRSSERVSKIQACIASENLIDMIAESSWRAALEWFYGKLDYSTEHEELKDIIEEELKDED